MPTGLRKCPRDESNGLQVFVGIVKFDKVPSPCVMRGIRADTRFLPANPCAFKPCCSKKQRGFVEMLVRTHAGVPSHSCGLAPLCPSSLRSTLFIFIVLRSIFRLVAAARLSSPLRANGLSCDRTIVFISGRAEELGFRISCAFEDKKGKGGYRGRASKSHAQSQGDAAPHSPAAWS
jgi:hypothetical protein